MTPAIRAKADGMGVPLLAAVPYDPQLVEFDGAGRPLVDLPADALVSVAVEEIAEKLLSR
jgi:CO dehydrogenase nickel-insertion accessory protein CooC1